MRIPKASEFFISGIEGLALNSKEQTFIKENPLGGIILFKRNIQSLEQVIALNTSIIETNNHFIPLICVDQEGGRVARLKDICTDLPPLALLTKAFLKEPNLAYRIAAMQARELVSLGFNLNFSPVCDITSNALNQVIGDRAFSSCPKTVANLASYFIRGLQGSGIAACAKHFPGHGATSIDSHLELPLLDTDFDTLWSRELMPFAEAIKAEVATIMTAHIVTESLDQLPATLSIKTLQHLLRQKLGYNNVIISDDLNMKAVSDHYSLHEIITKGLLASVDLFIIGHDFTKTLEATQILEELLEQNEELKKNAIMAAQRIDNLRKCYLGKAMAPDLSYALTIVRSHPHLELVRLCS